mmetsp:Transcript_59651/g.126803  ORF Transcript_59651/g.126803 Transcript_59651/m.126803 type:complete len:299 (-) Transcript_59651:687-1583(-)
MLDTTANSRMTTARDMPFPTFNESVSWKTMANATKHCLRHDRKMRSGTTVAKLRSISLWTEFAKLRILDASSRLVRHCSTSSLQAGELSVQFRFRDRSIPPATRRARGEFPHPFTMMRAWAKTGETFGNPFGRRPAAVSRSLTASCSEKMRTNTSCVMPGPTRPGIRVVISTRWGVSSKLLSPSLRVPKRNHLASSILHTSSRHISTRRESSRCPRSSFIPSSSPPWKDRRLVVSFAASDVGTLLMLLTDRPGGSEVDTPPSFSLPLLLPLDESSPSSSFPSAASSSPSPRSSSPPSS